MCFFEELSLTQSPHMSPHYVFYVTLLSYVISMWYYVFSVPMCLKNTMCLKKCALNDIHLF